MTDSFNTIATLNGNFKETYADKLTSLIPEGFYLLKNIPFIKDAKQPGNYYHQPVVVGLEHGFTYLGPLGDAAVDLVGSIPGQVKDAQVQGYEFVLKSTMSVATASRAKNSKAAFEQSTKLLVSNMYRSFARRLEVQLLHGQSNIGVVKAVTDGVTTTTVEIHDYAWAPGVFVGAEGMKVNFFSGSSLVSGASADYKITAVDFTARKITVDSGDVYDHVVDTNTIWFAGSYGYEFAGIDKIGRNTSTLFNIDAGAYGLWKGTVLGNSGTQRDLTLEIIENGAAYAALKGAADEKMVCIVSSLVWPTLLTEQAAKRMYDSSFDGKAMMNGSKEIKFFSQVGEITIVPSIYAKQGTCYILPMENLLRVGSSDITFDQPGFEGQFFRLIESKNAYELRAYADQALFCEAPGKIVVIDDIAGA